ncbi:glycerophosphodiester phosphodiesterase family protein [[Mycoplasma] testudinis]|uniref:glycerophosphodiester phosphodiesterase family protein n=1 Tax=[Mycoplasma] testudinis TaxID=33924 RepID=UPI00056D1C60|nr:glycerophosphodiester phosphodiesterase family protein [[Mycoplasma] testudinis]
MENKTKQLIIGHRGYRQKYPENTALAFEQAVAAKFDGVELDLQLTKDNHIVIIHDDNTQRVTGIKKSVNQSNLKDLKKLNYAAFFKKEMPKQTILTLEEFLDAYLNKFTLINLELKNESANLETYVKVFSKIISRFEPLIYTKVIISSFDLNLLKLTYQFNKKFKYAYLFKKHREMINYFKNHELDFCEYFHVKSNTFYLHLTNYLKIDKKWGLWTIKTKKTYLKGTKYNQIYAQICDAYLKDK